MKLLLSLMVTASTVLFAGGNILPIQAKIKYQPIIQKQSGCYKPNVQKCPNCVDVAEICPDDPNLPIVESEPCEANIGH